MADLEMVNVSMEFDSQEEKEEHLCDICHVSYTTDMELRDHHWSLMHHIKMEKQKKGSVHNCTLCFMTCANIIEYGKHLNEEKHKRAIEDSRRQREEEDLLMGRDVLMARIREKEERERKKYQNNKQKIDEVKKNADNNLSDPETQKNKHIGKRRSERLNNRNNLSGHQRSFSLPGRNFGPQYRHPPLEHQVHNDDFHLDRSGSNFVEPSRGHWNGGYGHYQQNQWHQNMDFQNYGAHVQNQNFHQPYCDDGAYSMQCQYDSNGWTLDRRGMREDLGQGNYRNQYNGDFYSDPNSLYELVNSGFPERSWQYGEPSRRYEDNHSGRGRNPNRWSRNNTSRENTKNYVYRNGNLRDTENVPMDSYQSSRNGLAKDDRVSNPKKNGRPQEKNGRPQEKNGKPQEKISEVHTDARSKLVDDEVNLPFKKPISPKSEKYIESMRESRDRSESSEKVSNKRRRYNSPSHSHERKSRQDKESRNTHIRFADDEISEKPFQHFDEADSTTSSGDKEELSSGSSGKKGSGGSKERKKGILKKKKKNGGKGSPLGSPKRSNRKGREDKGGEGVLEKAEKLCRELREKREKAKLERDRKMKLEQQEKLDNINQELKSLQDKSKEYVKGHILTEEMKLPDVSSAEENTEKDSSHSKSTKLSKPNKEIEKIRQSIEKSVQSVNEIEKLQSSLGLERNLGKKDLSSSTNKAVNSNSEGSGKDPVRRETSTKSDSVETRKLGLREEISAVSSKKPKEKPNTEALLKMVNSPRSRKERKQLAEMLRSYAQSQKKLSLPRYNLQLSGSYDDNLDGRIEELRLEELSPEVQIQIAQLMEAEAIPDLSDLEMALMSSSEKKNSLGGKSGREGGTSVANSTATARGQHHGLERVLQGSSKERQRTQSTDSDKIESTVRRREDSAHPLKFSDLSVATKTEPMDLEYEKAAQMHSSSPENMASHVTSTTNLGEVEKSMQINDISAPRMPQFSDQLPQRSTIQMDAALHNLSGSLSSLESGRSTESFFDTVYDISVKEEALRKDLTEADQFIQYFRNVIDEATIQLNRYNEKKLRLQTEEEKLRGQRLRLLQEARLQQRSGQSTPQLSEFEDQPRGQGREDVRKVMNPGHSSLPPTSQVSSYNDPHSSTLLNVLNRDQRLEPERDRQGFGSSFGTANSPVQANHNHPASDSILAQLRNLSSSLQQETISMETENKLDYSLPRDLGSIKKEPEEVYVSPDHVTSTQGPQGGIPTQSRPQGGIPTQSKEQTVNKEDSAAKLGAARGSIESHVQRKTINSEPAASRKVTDTNSLPPKPVKSSKPPVNKKPESFDPKNSTDVAHSAELRDAGFITLNSLIKTSNLKEDIDSDDEPLANVMRRQRQDSLRSEDSQKRCESDDSASEGKKFNMRYMGTLGVDSKAFLTQLGKCQGGSKSQGPSYVVLDKDTDAYQQIQSLIKGGKNDKETSANASAALDKKTVERGTKSLRGGHISDSNYESVNSNCSLGEQIRQYANQNKKGAKKKPEEDVVVVNTDSDSDRSDRTLQEDPALLSDSCTPVRMVKSCSSGLQNLNLDSSPQLATNQHSRHGREEEQTVRSAEESRSMSPFRKKLRTKKERDRTSSRKQKEDYVLDSSSDGGHSVDEDSVPKITEIKQQLVFKSLSNIPAALKAEGLDSEEAGLVETGSEDTDTVVCIKEEVISTDPQRRLLEDVQLESESEDNRQLAVEARERLSLDKEVMENFRKAVENMKSTLGLSALQTPEDLFLPATREPVQFRGPKEVISGLEVHDGYLYVSYQGKVINKFNLQTGELDFEFNTMSHDVNCILVSMTTDRLYVGANEMMLLSYCCKTKRPIKVEPTEGKPQCFHENWGNLYMGTDCGTVVVMSLKNDKVLDTFHCADRSISRICSATEGVRRVILVASFDAIIYVYDSSTGLLIRMLEGHTRTPFSLQVDGHLVFSGSGDKTVMEHNILTGELLWTYTEAGGIVSCVCTHGDQLFCASYDRLIRCYNKTSRKLQRLYYGAGGEDGLIIRMTICDGMLITGNRQGLVEEVPISQDNHTCQCGDCDFVFAVKSHLLYHVLHCHVLNNVRSGKKTPCPWKDCKDKFKSTASRKEFEEHVSLHVY